MHLVLIVILLILLVPMLPLLILVGIPVLLWVGLVVALAIGVVTVITNPRLRGAAATALLLALAVGAYFFASKPSVHIVSSTPGGSSSVKISGSGIMIADNREPVTPGGDPSVKISSSGIMITDNTEPVVRPVSDGDNSALRRALGTKDTPKSAPTPEPSDRAPPVDAPKPKKTPSAEKPPPDWTNRSAYLDGDTYYMVAKCGPINDPFWRESTVDMKLIATANVYIDDQLYRDRVAESLDLDAKSLRENCLVRQWPEPAETEPGDEVFVLMKFDKQFRDKIDHRYHAAISLDRATQAGGIAGVALLALAGVYSFLRLTSPQPPTPPYPQTPTH